MVSIQRRRFRAVFPNSPHASSSPSFCLWAHIPLSSSCTSKSTQFQPVIGHAARSRPRTRCQASPETKTGDRFVPCLCRVQRPAPREINGEFTWPQCRQRAVTSKPELRRLVIRALALGRPFSSRQSLFSSDNIFLAARTMGESTLWEEGCEGQEGEEGGRREGRVTGHSFFPPPPEVRDAWNWSRLGNSAMRWDVHSFVAVCTLTVQHGNLPLAKYSSIFVQNNYR